MYKSIFQHPSWLNVLSKTYNFKIISLIKTKNLSFEIKEHKPDYFFDENTIISFVSKDDNKNLISLPFTDFIDFNDSYSQELVSFIIDRLNPKKIEFRAKIKNNNLENKLVGYKHNLSLIPEIDIIFNKFKLTQVQQPIGKSIKEGLEAHIDTDYKTMLDFYELHLKTRRKLGIPVQPKKFFKNIWEDLINKNLGFIVMVYWREIPVSSGIFLGNNDVLVYKFSASNPNLLKLRPNNLMLWTAIQEAKKRGFKVFDFGRTELENEGLRRFKLGWGTVEEPLYYSYYPKAPDTSKFLWIKNKVVSPLIKNSPKFVCRFTGELFYKYFG